MNIPFHQNFIHKFYTENKLKILLFIGKTTHPSYDNNTVYNGSFLVVQIQMQSYQRLFII